MTSVLKFPELPAAIQPNSSLRCLRQAALFSKLSVEYIACFVQAAHTRSYAKGKILYLQEEPTDYFYVIQSGWIKLFHTMPEGEEVIVDMLTTGDMVGESAIFEQGRHTSSAEIVENVHLLCLPSKLLQDQIRQNPTLALGMLASMSRHHRRHYDAIALNAMQSAPKRIGYFLLRLCPRDRKKDIILQLPYDKTLIAATLGMNGATFSRALNILRQKTGMRLDGSRVDIAAIEPLAKYVYGPLAVKYMPEDI